MAALGRRACPLSLAPLAKAGLRLPASASLPLASCWPRPQQLLPVSATGGGRRRCPQRGSPWQAGPLPTGRLSPDMAQKGGPRYRGQARLCTTSPSRLRRATSPCRRGFGSPRKVNGFARGSPTRGAVERSETERLYEGKSDREPPAGLPSPSSLARCHLSQRERLSAPFCSKSFLKIHFIGLLFCYTPVRTKRHRREEE